MLAFSTITSNLFMLFFCSFNILKCKVQKYIFLCALGFFSLFVFIVSISFFFGMSVQHAAGHGVENDILKKISTMSFTYLHISAKCLSF